MNSKTVIKEDILMNIAKPVRHIESLIQSFVNDIKPLTIANKRHISLTLQEERHCLILIKGSIALYRISDGMTLNAENAPFIFGANIQLSYSRHLYARAKETSTVLLIPQSVFYKEIKKRNLWHSLALLQDYTAAKVYAHCLTVSQLSAYEIIRCHLLELMEEPESVRHKITAVNYIMDHSFLSRSGTMRILAKLKHDDYIRLSRGILTEIVHLPEKMDMFYSKTDSLRQCLDAPNN